MSSPPALPYSSYSELLPSPAFYPAPPASAPPLLTVPSPDDLPALALDDCSLSPVSVASFPGSVDTPFPPPIQDDVLVPDVDLDLDTAFLWQQAPQTHHPLHHPSLHHAHLAPPVPVVYHDHDAYLGAHPPPLLHATRSFSADDLHFASQVYSGAHSHLPAFPPHSYTRMFRGRKSKPASEVLDELRPYACDICQAAFARSHDRDRHKRSHTGETPYQCHGCGAGFKRPDARKRHWERDPICAQEDWRRVQNTAEGAKRRARAKGRQLKPSLKKTIRL